MKEENLAAGSSDLDAVPTVAGNVLLTFFDELAKLDDLADVAINLKKLVMEDAVFSEPAIRTVIFPDAS